MPFKKTKASVTKFFKRTFKKQPDYTAGEIFSLIVLLLLVVAWAGPAAVVKGQKKKK
jgi:hypothetical protein